MKHFKKVTNTKVAYKKYLSIKAPMNEIDEKLAEKNAHKKINFRQFSFRGKRKNSGALRYQLIKASNPSIIPYCYTFRRVL